MTRTIELIGHITKNGELEAKLPAGLPSGEVRITIELPADTNEPDLTAEEVAELLKPEPPKSGAEIAAALESGELDTSAWRDVQDGASWVEEHRHNLKVRSLHEASLPPGTPGATLAAHIDDFEFAPGAVDEMMKVIEEGCDQTITQG